MNAVLSPFRALLNNPVLRREMDDRIRSRSGAVLITVWLLALSGVFWLAYVANVALTSEFNDAAIVDVARIGRQMLDWTLTGMLSLVLFLVPAFTSGAVAGERERGTLLPLQVSMLSPLSIILGKISAGLAFTMLLVVMTAPLLAISFLVGGVTAFDVVKGMFMVLVTAGMIGSIGVAISARVKRVQTAVVMTYGATLLFVIGPFAALLLWVVLGGVFTGEFDETDFPKDLLAFNPYFATADIFDHTGRGGADTPLAAGREMIDGINDWRGNNNEDETRVWRWYLVIAALCTYLSIGAGVRRVRAPAETER